MNFPDIMMIATQPNKHEAVVSRAELDAYFAAYRSTMTVQAWVDHIKASSSRKLRGATRKPGASAADSVSDDPYGCKDRLPM
jgi:hypothetical protein